MILRWLWLMLKRIIIEFKQKWWWWEKENINYIGFDHIICPLGQFPSIFSVAVNNDNISFPFSVTISKVQNNAEYFYRRQRYIITREYFEKPIIPVPPLILLCYLWMLIQYFWHRWRPNCTRNNEHEEDECNLIKIFSRFAS